MANYTSTANRSPSQGRLILTLPFIGYLIFISESAFARPSLIWASLLLVWAAVATILAWRLVRGRAQQLFDGLDRYASLTVLGIIATATIAFITVSVLQTHYFAISVQAEDTAYYSQVLWNTLHGNFLSGNVQQERLYNPPVSTDLALHVSPVLLGLLPVYALFPSSLTLLIIRDMALAAAAWPLFLLAREKIGGTAGVATAVLYLMNPVVIAQSCEAFYLLHFAPFPFFWTLWTFSQKKFRQFFLWLAIALCVREDVAIAMTGFGVLAFVGKRQWKWILLGTGTPIVWWGITTLLIQPAFGRWSNSALDIALAGGKSTPLGIYQSLLGSPLWILEVLQKDGLDYLYRLLRSVSFLGILGWEGVLVVPSLVANLFLARVFYSGTDPVSRFALLPSCALIGTTVLVVWRYGQKYHWDKQVFAVIMFLLLLSVSLLDGMKDAIQNRLSMYTVRNDSGALREALTFIPGTASVAAPNYALSALANRRELFYVTFLRMYPGAHPDYILLDRNLDRITTNTELREHYTVLLKDFSHSKDYEVVWQQGEYFLLRRADLKL